MDFQKQYIQYVSAGKIQIMLFCNFRLPVVNAGFYWRFPICSRTLYPFSGLPKMAENRPKWGFEHLNYLLVLLVFIGVS